MNRRTRVLAGAGVLVAAAVTGGIIAIPGANGKSRVAQEPPTNTVRVERRALSAMVSLDGNLTYQAGPDGSPYSVINQAQGTYTELPQIGQVVSQGQTLYRVDDIPVILLYGSTPAYRSLSAGATGADVAELNSDLVTLGYATRARLIPTSPVFGPATTVALEKLQAAEGLTQTGVLSLGQAVFQPTAVRVTTVLSQLGGTARAGQTVLQGSSTIRQVQVAVTASQQTDLAVGDKVTVTLPDNRTTPGIVSSVGTVAVCPSGSGSSGSSSTTAGAGTGTCPPGNSGSRATPSIAVDVTPSDPAATGTWDQAPVQVTITTASVPAVLVVPVAALLAQSGGGYAVEVVDPGGTHRLVGVSLGLFDDAEGLVQVTGSQLAAGQQVVVPAT